jgi:hypothetical protein
MTLREWNETQCEVFKRFQLEDVAEIYRYASLIAWYRNREYDLEIVEEITNYLKKELK